MCRPNRYLYLPVTQNETIFSVSTSPNSTEITKLICLCIVFATTSKGRKKLKNFQMNRKDGRFKTHTKKAEYRKTWQVCICAVRDFTGMP